MSGVNEIRSAFLDYFEKNDHQIVASSPLVPHNDPTLMFVNSGMVQFKNVFTGLEKRDRSRAVSSQKCVRAGGKHNDLDNVGYTARHHTFFEMLGNFSFGDYFKDLAIELSWNLLTREFGLSKDKLLVTVYHNDDQAFDLWKKISGLPERNIIRISTNDNFWSMGETGPCGPCSEIFYDHGDKIAGGPPGSADEDGDRFIEIWNLVFMQYEQVSPDQRIDLPSPSIDTGLGLERLAAVMQGKHDNYEIDLFRALIEASEEITGVAASGEHRSSHRVIADHLRTSSFLLAEGVLPSNEGRGYVLRRIMRRAMRHLKLLGCDEPVFWRLVPALIKQMGAAFPELVRAEALISDTLKLEETKFRTTLSRGLDLLNSETSELSSGDVLPGKTAFKLYDTYGFPLDLTEDALRPRGISVDISGFDAAMDRQKKAARAAWSGSGDTADEAIWFDLKDQHGATEFLGYETENSEAVVLAIVATGQLTDTATVGDEISVITNQSPFYGESGGQEGDAGLITNAGTTLKISNTLKKNAGLLVHVGRLEKGELRVGDAVSMQVDHARRSSLRRNHSATHLLHESLRLVLGEHVAQKGSLVSAGRLRFDFSHNQPIDAVALDKIENIANEVVLQNNPVTTRIMDVDDAIEAGAMALFGEKYGDVVRVVSMGDKPQGTDKPFSVELCGGTHVSSTGDIGIVTVLSEGAVSSGVRRIEALTGSEARIYLVSQRANLNEIATVLKVPAAKASDRVRAIVVERKNLERQLADAKRQLAMAGTNSNQQNVVTKIEVAGGELKFIGRVVDRISPRELKGLVDEHKINIGSGIVAIATNAPDGKAGIVVGITSDLAGIYDAVELVILGSKAIGGKGGGGRPDMAQAGGPDGAKAGEAITAIENRLRDLS